MSTENKKVVRPKSPKVERREFMDKRQNLRDSILLSSSPREAQFVEQESITLGKVLKLQEEQARRASVEQIDAQLVQVPNIINTPLFHSHFCLKEKLNQALKDLHLSEQRVHKLQEVIRKTERDKEIVINDYVELNEVSRQMKKQIKQITRKYENSTATTAATIESEQVSGYNNDLKSIQIHCFFCVFFSAYN